MEINFINLTPIQLLLYKTNNDGKFWIKLFDNIMNRARDVSFTYFFLKLEITAE
jgi:hypothetical protein